MAEPSPDGATAAPGDPLVISESEAFALLAHLVTSAELCMVEPYNYGVFRLIDAASRLAGCMALRASPASRGWLDAFREEVNSRKMLPVRDRERYQGFLREMSRRTAEHLVEQARTGQADSQADSIASPTGDDPDAS